MSYELTEGKAIRRYYLGLTQGWQHTDYVVTGPVYEEHGSRRVPVRRLGGASDSISLYDMGVVRGTRGKFNAEVYTVAL